MPHWTEWHRVHTDIRDCPDFGAGTLLTGAETCSDSEFVAIAHLISALLTYNK